VTTGCSFVTTGESSPNDLRVVVYPISYRCGSSLPFVPVSTHDRTFGLARSEIISQVHCSATRPPPSRILSPGDGGIRTSGSKCVSDYRLSWWFWSNSVICIPRAPRNPAVTAPPPPSENRHHDATGSHEISGSSSPVSVRHAFRYSGFLVRLTSILDGVKNRICI